VGEQFKKIKRGGNPPQLEPVLPLRIKEERWKMYRILCVIGARGGSKRLPKKNLQIYGNKTLIHHAIDVATKSNYISTVVFDSEDEEMLTHAREIEKEYNENFIPMVNPILLIHKRDPELSKDNISLYAPIKKVIEEHSFFNLIVILQVDNPTTTELIDRCIAKFWEMDEKIRKEKLDDDNQFFEEVSTFHNNVRTGSVRVITRDAFLSEFPTSKIAMVEDDVNHIDIQFEKDLKKANYFLKHPKHDTFWVSSKIKEPIEYNTRMILNHFNRYLSAVRKLKIRDWERVLDASCGQGYGTFIISQFAGRVFGFDVNEDYIAKAKEYYPNLDFFLYADAEKMSKDFFDIDKIICIETFEHIPKDMIESYIGKLFGYLCMDGDMFVTIPLGNDCPSKYNEFHLNEPSLPTIKKLLLDRFKKSNIKIDTFYNSFNEWQEYCMISLIGFKGE